MSDMRLISTAKRRDGRTRPAAAFHISPIGEWVNGRFGRGTELISTDTLKAATSKRCDQQLIRPNGRSGCRRQKGRRGIVGLLIRLSIKEKNAIEKSGGGERTKEKDKEWTDG